MFQSYMDALAFHCLKQLKEERTVYSAFHIISGKKTSQTIQDCYLFGLGPYFRTYTHLTRDEFDASILRMAENGYIRIKDEKGKYTLTESGMDAFHDYVQTAALPKHINGFLYQNSLLFWQRFNLLFQVMSNGVYQNRVYLPIQRDTAIQRWLKQFLSTKNEDFESLAGRLHDELESALADLPHLNALVFMMRLSGFHRIGYSVEQIGKKLGKDSFHIQYLFLDAFHYIISRSLTSAHDYPILSTVFQEGEQQQPSNLTKSSYATWQFLKKGYGIEEIMNIRKLKRNTIEDHIVEIALHTPGLNLAPYIDDALLDEIYSLIEQLKTKQLKVLKRNLSEEVTYFQIRLALAKGGGNK